MRRWGAITILVLSIAPAWVRGQDGPKDSERTVAEKVPPTYPDLARKTNLEGVVRLRAIVAPNGKAKLIEVMGGNPVLAKAAQDAVAKWKWTPGPQETKEVVILNFRPR